MKIILTELLRAPPKLQDPSLRLKDTPYGYGAREGQVAGQHHSSILPNHVIGATLLADILGTAPARRAFNRQPPGRYRSALLKHEEVPDETYCSVT